MRCIFQVLRVKIFVLLFFYLSIPIDYASTANPKKIIKENHPNVLKWSDKILKYSGKHWRLVASIMDRENSGNNRPGILIAVYDRLGNFAGYDRARCGMQVVPYYHKDKIKGRNIDDPDVCVEVAMQVLIKCGIDRNYRKALECYNPGADESYYTDILEK